MNKLSYALLIASAFATQAMAAGFNGPAAPANFNVANIGTLSGGSPSFGTATFSAVQLVLVGSNSISPAPASFAPGCTGGIYSTLPSPCELRVTLAVPGTYSFNWSYVTADESGPGGDIFGVWVDGNRVVLSDLGGAVAQTGSASFTATTSFGWFMNCTDCIGGAATATVSSFSLTSAVPEPATNALLLAGVAGISGLGVLQRRRRARAS